MAIKKKSAVISAAVVVVLGGLFALFSLTNSATAQTASSDAIAVRVVPNPNHHSIARWYEAQGFSGSPQSLIVDGYEAIRDGRTVYVAAANIDETNRLIYTNIYLISYNQDPAPNTVDILGQMIAHWKFNDNLLPSAVAPTCSISSLSCASDTDCAENQYCAPASAGAVAASCQLDTVKNCLTDTDCPANFFCDSLKAKITRDVKRVGQLEELKESLYNFKQINKRYPYLSAGTYIAGRTISVWPSWSQSFLPELASSQNFSDPINRLGACSGYDAKTCWDENAKKFVNTIPVAALSSNELPTLPAGSYAFAYATDTNGSNYKLCAVLESREPALNYSFYTNDPANTGITNCTTAGVGSIGSAGNTAPKLIESSLVGEAGKEFNGFIKFTDAENNPLSWSLVKNGSWTDWQGGPVLQDTSNPYQKKVYATAGGAPGTYSLSVVVSDGLATTIATTTATILGQAPFIEAADAEYVLDPVNPFTYHFNFSGLHLDNPNINTPVVTKTGGPNDILSPAILIAAGPPSKSFSQIGNNKYRIDYQGLISTAFKLKEDLSFKYNIKVTDKYNNVASKSFLIKLKVEKPLLDPACSPTVRAGHYYSCALGTAKQGNHSITYSVAELPSWLSISGQTLSGTSTLAATTTNLGLIATNEYGATTIKGLTLKTNSYCGDGIKQSPNTEGRGGIYNDGYEDCDGTDSIITTPAGSNIDKQYGCSAGATGETAIFNNNYCIFKSPLDGGGYCGDGYCQMEISGRATENCKTCQEDCGNCVATIESYARDEQIAYFNGARIYNSAWPTLGTATRTLLTGDNLFAFWPHSLNTNKEEHGLVYRVLVGPPSDPYDVIDPTNSVLKCAKAADTSHVFGGGKSASGYEPSSELINSGYRWTENGFTASTAFVAAPILAYDTMSNVHLNQINIKVAGASTTAAYLPYVWGVQENFATSSAYYCRLNYDYKLGNLGVCRPRCNGIVCGSSNGCGGTCVTGSGCCAKSCGNKCPGMANCAISGTITDYLTDDKMSGALVVLKDLNSNTLASATTGSDGKYSFSVISSEKSYAITVSKSGYDNGQKTFLPNEDKTLDFTLAPAGYSGVKKFKLTWGVSPADLDSHLEFATSSIYYGKCNREDLNQAGITACETIEKAILDKDDRQSTGPENIRIVNYQSASTTYHYYVEDYSNNHAGTSCDLSGAKVSIYDNNSVRTHIFTGSSGKCFWCVADVDIAGNVTVPSVTYGNSVSDGICTNPAPVSNCTPNCAGKCGGNDGCNGTCPNICGAGFTCVNNTNCQTACAPKCKGKCLNEDDECGGKCPNPCGNMQSGYQCKKGYCCPAGCDGIVCGNDACSGCYIYRDVINEYPTYSCIFRGSLCHTNPSTGVQSCCGSTELITDTYTKCPELER